MRLKLLCLMGLPAVAFGVGATVKEAPIATPAKVKQSVTKSMALMTASGNKWFKIQTCASCHHQGATFLAYGSAQQHGIKLDEASLQKQVYSTYGSFENPGSFGESIQGAFEVDPGLTEGLMFDAASSCGIKPSAVAAAEVRFNTYRQAKDGSFPTIDFRPPQISSLIASTAYSVRSIQLYLKPFDPTLASSSTSRARTWLENSVPVDEEDSAYKVLGLKWSGSTPAAIASAKADLLKLQNEDGGWSQLPTRSSDAYATGVAMLALHEGAGMPCTDPSYRKGMDYLLSTQKPDGSWQVTSRINQPAPISPPYFESSFPYGHSQFVSITGTALASMALMDALPMTNAPVKPLFVPKHPNMTPSWMPTVAFGSVNDLKKLLAKGFDPNSQSVDGTTALMMAVPQTAKVRLLLAKGAKVNASSKLGYTALMVAANSGEGLDCVKLLMSKGASTATPKKVQFGATPFLLAANSGDLEKLKALNPAAADLKKKMVVGGVFNVDALGTTLLTRNAEMAKYLVLKGGDVNQKDELGISLLDTAVLIGNSKFVETLIALGANVNYRDPMGMSPLLWSCMIDRNTDKVYKLLLDHGADPTAKTKDGLDAVQLSKRNNLGTPYQALSVKN